jgi:hypothetical protein
MTLMSLASPFGIQEVAFNLLLENIKKDLQQEVLRLKAE